MVTASEGDRLEDINATVLKAKKVLETMYGPTVPAEAIAIRVPIWKHDPNFRGSYSNIAVGTSGSDFMDMEGNVGGIWFAGEAYDWNWNGFVVGTYLSGDRVAKCVAKTISTSCLR